MANDPRNEVWNAAYKQYYEAYYYEIACNRMVGRWRSSDDLTKVLVAIKIVFGSAQTVR
jgi:hypothetical protein